MGSQYPSILNEKVLGKSVSLKKCELILDDVINAYQSKVVDMKVVLQGVKEVEKELESHFNFGCLSLTFSASAMGPAGAITSMLVPNAYTMKVDPLSAAIKGLRNDSGYKITSTGFKWDKGMFPFTEINVFLGLLNIKGITGGEVLAIILHEIGHNFYAGSTVNTCLSFVGSITSMLYKVLAHVESMLIGLSASAMNNSFFKAIFNFCFTIINNVIVAVMGLFSGDLKNSATRDLLDSVLGKEGSAERAASFSYSTSVLNIIGTLLLLIKFPAALVKQLIGMFTNVGGIVGLIKLDGLTEERFSDEFAVFHGYGSELSSVFTRMQVAGFEKDKEDSKANRTGAQAVIMTSYFNSILYSFALFLDPHPSVDSRAVFIADYYKNAIKNSKSAKEKKFLNDQMVSIIKNSAPYLAKSNSDRAKYIRAVIDNDTKSIARLGFFDKVKDMFSSDKYLLSSIINGTELSESMIASIEQTILSEGLALDEY